MIKNIPKQYESVFLLILIIIMGGFLRFYKLDWGEGLFSHPDEYHIVSSVAQLSFPNQMHPHFFSYGTVTIYLIYFTQELLKQLYSVFNFQFSIFNSFLIGRFYSALFSTFTIFIVYKICRSFMEKRFSYLAALLTALTPGLIQQAHFATPESTLIFFLLASLLFMIKFVKKKSLLYLFLASMCLGFALGVKISSIVLLLPLAITIIFTSLKDPFRLIGLFITSLFTIFITLRITAPYIFIDFPAFRGNLEYEGRLAIGTLPVFYTRQFVDTIPVLFQLEKIFPYALGPALLVFGILGFFLIVVKHLGWWRKHQTFDSSEVDGHLGGIHPRFAKASPGESATSKVFKNDLGEILLLITIAFLSLFLPNALLFAKWTRFIAPTFPFFAIFAVFLLQETNKKISSRALIVTLLIPTILWTLAFFTIYLRSDIRITASNWIEKNFPENSIILIEGGNMIDIPLKGNFKRIGFDFYNLEADAPTRTAIVLGLDTAGYFLIQSRRVFMNHQRLPELFPKTSNFYNALFNEQMGFEQIKEFHSYPALEIGNWKLEIPDEGAEETWSVFDHPVIRFFKKKTQLTKDDYARFLGI